MSRSRRLPFLCATLGLPLLLIAGLGCAADDEAQLQLVGSQEPGDPLRISVQVVSSGRTAVDGLAWTVYQTDARGYYRQGDDGTELGGAHARLTGRVEPGESGGFEVVTIRPAPYPGGGVPAHVHFQAADASGTEVAEHTVRVREASGTASGGDSTCRLRRTTEGSWACSIRLTVP